MKLHVKRLVAGMKSEFISNLSTLSVSMIMGLMAASTGRADSMSLDQAFS